MIYDRSPIHWQFCSVATASWPYRWSRNNIANVNTDGYVRQDLDLQEGLPTKNGLFYLGSGVTLMACAGLTMVKWNPPCTVLAT